VTLGLSFHPKTCRRDEPFRHEPQCTCLTFETRSFIFFHVLEEILLSSYEKVCQVFPVHLCGASTFLMLQELHRVPKHAYRCEQSCKFYLKFSVFSLPPQNRRDSLPNL
jgi:hypothetical protein